MMHPTGGLGNVEPCAERARESAACIIFVSRSICWGLGDGGGREVGMGGIVAGISDGGGGVCLGRFLYALPAFVCAFGGA